MAFQQNAFQHDAFQVGLLEPAPPDSPPNRPIIFANGNSVGAILALGFAIGGAVIFNHGEFAPTQPQPVEAQYEHRTRTPWLGGDARVFGINPALIPVAAQDPLFGTIVVRAENDARQIAPLVFKQQPAPSVTPLLRPTSVTLRVESKDIISPLVFRQQLSTEFFPSVELFDQPQFLPPTIQPLVFKGVFAGVQVESPPLRPTFFAKQQDSPYQTPSVVFETLIFEATPLKGIISASSQADPTQIQPVVFKQQPAPAAQAIVGQLSAPGQFVPNTQAQISLTPIAAALQPPPLGPTLFASEQPDPTQLQPVVTPFYFDQSRDATPNRPLYAFPQADTTVLQPVLFPIAELPSVPPQPRVEIIGGDPGPKKHKHRKDLINELVDEVIEARKAPPPKEELPNQLNKEWKVVPKYAPRIDAIPPATPLVTPLEPIPDIKEVDEEDEIRLLISLGLL